METPFFAHRLGTGNAVVGCWLKVYDEIDVIEEFPIEGTPKQRATPNPKDWWNKAPSRVTWDKNGNISRKPNQIYHFLLPDDNMLASADIKLIKEELNEAQKKRIIERKKEFKKPLSKDECKRLEKLCSVIDVLLNEHYNQIKAIIKDTTSAYAIYGQIAPQIAIKGYDEKERLSESRNDRSAPFYKLRMVMDYWCSLWFWDAREIADFPTRTEWINEIENILGVDISNFSENISAKEIIENIKKQSSDTSSLFGNENRLHTVERLRDQHRYFHHELEFLEVFKEKNGFDVIVGNPPWLKLQFEEKDIIAEQFPEVLIRKTTAPQVRNLQVSYLSIDNQKDNYLKENVGIESSAQFLNAVQNYPLLIGQQTNLYKCIIENSFALVNKNGFIGLLHPESIYDDPAGKVLRKEVYQRLDFHFQFVNILKLFSEIIHWNTFSINIYSGNIKKHISFFNMNNLFQSKTINESFAHNSTGKIGGIKIMSDTGNMTWNTLPHRNRIVNVGDYELKMIAKTFEDSDDFKSAKLVSLHSTEIINIIKIIGNFPKRVSEEEIRVLEGWHETNDVNNGIIKRSTQYPNFANTEMIFGGVHLYVSNPLYKNPRSICKIANTDYDVIDLNLIDDDWIARANYVPLVDKIKLDEILKGFQLRKDNNGKAVYDNWLDYYKVGFRKMIATEMERTLTGAILPPNTTHIHGVISVTFKDVQKLIEFTGITSSLVMDFFIKTLGASNLYLTRINAFPIGIAEMYKKYLNIRVCLLNCVNIHYSKLWELNWVDEYKNDNWSKLDNRLSNFHKYTNNWNRNTPLRNSFERRWALIEIDVIVAISMGISLLELTLMYEIQFPVLQQNEDDTWYDQKGNIIFTCSKGLTGVGLDRPEWEKITEDVNSMQRKLKDGDTYIHTIKKSELYLDQQITYYAPFDKCDRVEDYKMAWVHFEKLFSEEKK
jgi:hypothetical protein